MPASPNAIRAEEHKVASFANMQAVIDAIPNPTFVKDRSHRLVLINASACSLFGHSRETMLSRSHVDLFPEDQMRGFHAADDLAFETGREDENEEEVTDSTGRVRHVITRKRIALIDGSEHLVASVNDITAAREAEARSRYLAFHDTLTGLPNRAMLQERIEQGLSRKTHSGALLYIDLDHFKEVNDTYGHPVGDELIQEFASRLSEIVRAADTVARLGGDEFAVFLSDTSHDPDADDVCRRTLIAAARAFKLTGAQVFVGASIGVVLTAGIPIIPSELQRRADVALYQAKNDGRGCFRIFTEALDDRAKHRQAIQADLRDALATGSGLEVHYQPMMDISSGEIEGFEALLRWQHPTRGRVMPDEFISIAERSGQIIELDEWVLTTACIEAAGWERQLRLSVNISPIEFAYGDLPSMLERALLKSGLDPARLELEITEGVLIEDPAQALDTFKRIKALGVQIALDDFGVGYSSLGYFRQFPFDKVKIDRSFISEMLDSSRARCIVQAAISLALGLKIKVVAEGVETEQQFALLAEQGCTQAQGYLIGRPMQVPQFQPRVA